MNDNTPTPTATPTPHPRPRRPNRFARLWPGGYPRSAQNKVLEQARLAFGNALSMRGNMMKPLGEISEHDMREAMADALEAIGALK